ncbi:MAG: sensor histidine kinase, partial [Lachnospiraceae bacterium]|nr:sensor histidine kinase [Lachnospiraceae bacterium]
MVLWLGVEFFGLAVISAHWGRSIPVGVPAACIFEKILILFGVIYLVEKFESLRKAGEAIAEGDLEYKVDTSKMIPSLKQHGENLNRIGEGLGRAVTERMKSEHLKTELITNVSHDIKTPLTSIINYADLLGSGGVSSEQVAEYSEVLLRQSRRLKKLLEDLVEASKATTGSLEVNMTACQAEVLLTQAAGEYEQRFEDKQLQLVVREPEEEIWIRADGRHLWRVFDNLLNNICKYAQENTRVYLSLERMEEKAVITFRNTSKYQLDVSADELMERFVRGDKSRNMEGNGLGLSIAKSLVELQKGNMEIVVDGDLFKVILTFAVTQKPEEAE